MSSINGDKAKANRRRRHYLRLRERRHAWLKKLAAESSAKPSAASSKKTG